MSTTSTTIPGSTIPNDDPDQADTDPSQGELFTITDWAHARVHLLLSNCYIRAREAFDWAIELTDCPYPSE